MVCIKDLDDWSLLQLAWAASGRITVIASLSIAYLYHDSEYSVSFPLTTTVYLNTIHGINFIEHMSNV